MEYTNPANWPKDNPKVVALDPAWGSTSKYGICVAMWEDQRIVICHAKEYNFGNFSDMITELFRLRNLLGHVSCYMVDSSAPEVINTIRREMSLDKSHLVNEINNSEVFGVSLNRKHVYNRIEKGIKCLICGFSDVRFGVK